MRKNKHFFKQLCVSVLYFLLCPLAIGATGVVQAKNVRDAFYTEVIPRLNSEISYEHFEELKRLQKKDEDEWVKQFVVLSSLLEKREELINEKKANEWFPNYSALPKSADSLDRLLKASQSNDIQAKRALVVNYLNEPHQKILREKLIRELAQEKDLVGAIYFSRELMSEMKVDTDLDEILNNLALLGVYADNDQTQAQIEYLLGNVIFSVRLKPENKGKFKKTYASLITNLTKKTELLSFDDLERLNVIFKLHAPGVFITPANEIDNLREKLSRGHAVEQLSLMWALSPIDMQPTSNLGSQYKTNYIEIYNASKIMGGPAVGMHLSKVLAGQIPTTYEEIIWDLRWLTRTINESQWKKYFDDSFGDYANLAVTYALRQGDFFTAKYFQSIYKEYLSSTDAKKRTSYFQHKESYLLNELEILLLLRTDVDASFTYTNNLITEDPFFRKEKMNNDEAFEFLNKFIVYEYRYQNLLNRLIDFTTDNKAIAETIRLISDRLNKSDSKAFAEQFSHEFSNKYDPNHPYKFNSLSILLRNKFLAHKGMELSLLANDKESFNFFYGVFDHYINMQKKQLTDEQTLLQVNTTLALSKSYYLYKLPSLSSVYAMKQAFDEDGHESVKTLLISTTNPINDIKLLLALLRINTPNSIALFKYNFSKFLSSAEDRLSTNLFITPHEKRLLADLIIYGYKNGHISKTQIIELIQSTQSLELSRLSANSPSELIKARLIGEINPLDHPLTLVARKLLPKRKYSETEVRESLKNNELFINYLHGENGKIILSFTSSETRIDFRENLSNKDVLILTDKIMNSLKGDAFDTASSQKLSSLILPDFDKNIDTLLISPSPELSQLSFSLLQKDKEWLISDYDLSITPSYKFLIERKTLPTLYRFLGIGSPFIGKALESPAYRGSGGNLTTLNIHKNLAFLEYAFDELKETSSRFKSSVLLTGQDATEEKAKKTISDNYYSVISFATHAVKPDEVTDLSQAALILTPDIENDGLLTTSEIIDLDFSMTNLVNLSACNTASKDSRISNEAFTGLVASFFATGANNILATHQPILDRAGKDFNTSFFASSKDIPLRARFSNAIRSLLASKDPIKSNPNYWGNFVLLGAGD